VLVLCVRVRMMFGVRDGRRSIHKGEN